MLSCHRKAIFKTFLFQDINHREVCFLEEKEIGCARPTGALVGEPEPAPEEKAEPAKKEVQGMTIMVGRKAPDFEAPVYQRASSAA